MTIKHAHGTKPTSHNGCVRSASILGQVLCLIVTQTPQLPSRHTLEEYMLKIHSILNFSLRLPACSFMS